MYRVIKILKRNHYFYQLWSEKRAEILPKYLATILRSQSSDVNKINKNIPILQTNLQTEMNKKGSFAEQIMNNIPFCIQPYMKIVRLHKPIGNWLIYWPCSWGITLAATPGCYPDPYLLTLFGAGSILMRGIGCIINDMWDRDIDSKVARTCDRPLVNGTLTIQRAFGFLAGQLSIGLLVLLQLNWYSVILGASSLGLVIIYPLMKRITYWPQFFLGITLNWGILVGFAAVHGTINWAMCLPMYGAAVCWTIIYDTIYAHQDIADDMLLGVKSTAIRFQGYTKQWLYGFNALMTTGFTISGIATEQTWPYYLTVMLVNSHIAWQIYSLNIQNPNDCFNKYKSNYYIGLILFCGILFGNLLKNKHTTKNEFQKEALNCEYVSK